MKSLHLLVSCLFLTSLAATEPDELIEQLPAIRSKALSDTAKQRTGNTTEMIDAAISLRDRLLPHIVLLESKLENKPENEVRTQIERDLDAVARDARIRGHSGGWGGTAVGVDAAWAVVEHLEARASWCVWQLMKDSKTFNFEEWRTCWTTNSDQGEDVP